MDSFQPADYIVYFHSFDKRTDSFQISVAASCEMYVCDDVIFYLYLDITAACTLCSVIYFHDVEVFAAIKNIPDKAGHSYNGCFSLPALPLYPE